MPSSPSGSDWMRSVREQVDARLASYLEAKMAEASRVSPESTVLVEAVADLTLRGGKRLRPAVLVAAFRAVAPEAPIEQTVDCSAAVEILQTYLLIHDDWMDGDAERRGGPSVPAAMRARFGDAHLGDCMAVLAGDLASAWAFELLLRSPFPADLHHKGYDAFLRMEQEVFFGQQLDLAGSADVSRMHHLKTGSYTVRGPLALGALLGGGDAEQRTALERFGEPLGLAFQLRDDLLGCFGDASTMGKPTGSDLRRGRQTSLVQAARELLSPEARAPIEGVLGRPDATEAELSRAVELLVSSGVRAHVEGRLEALGEQAYEALASAPLHEPGRTMLRDVAHRLVSRDH